MILEYEINNKFRIQQITLKSFGWRLPGQESERMVFPRQMTRSVAEVGTEPGLGFVQKRRKERMTMMTHTADPEAEH